VSCHYKSITQLVKKFPTFREPEGSLLCLQDPATDPVFSRTKITISLPLSVKSILILSSLLCPGLPSGFHVFQPKFCMHFSSLIHTTCVTHLTLLDFTTLKICGKACKLRNFSLSSLHEPPTTFSLLAPNHVRRL